MKYVVEMILVETCILALYFALDICQINWDLYRSTTPKELGKCQMSDCYFKLWDVVSLSPERATAK